MSEPTPVTFDVVAADEGTEIFLIDNDFKLVARGIGRETFSVPPGIYKIKARSGKSSAEKMLFVREGMAPVRLDPVVLASAMPLLNSAKTHEFHMSAAEQAAVPPAPNAEGSAIVIVARQWTAPRPPATPTAAPPHPARGLALRDLSGNLIADVERLTSVETPFDPCVTLQVAVDPGSYRLTLAYEDGRRVEQALTACEGWQTQVYLLLDSNPDRDKARADLVNGAVTMRRPGEGFKADDPKLRQEEIARGALQCDRKILSADMRAQIASPGASPMLALLGAHLLIREAKDAKAKREDEGPAATTELVDNRAEVRKIVDNLRAAIGVHPDVEAIAIGAGNPDPEFAFAAPPSFRASWRLLLKASVQQPDLLPAGSFPARLAERMWGEGPWLLWLDPDTADAVDRSALWQAMAGQMLSSGERQRLTSAADLAAIPAVAATPMSDAMGSAGDLLSSLKSYFTSRSRRPFPDFHEQAQRAAVPEAAGDLAGLPATLTDDQRRALVKRLGVPMSSISAWFAQRGR